MIKLRIVICNVLAIFVNNMKTACTILICQEIRSSEKYGACEKTVKKNHKCQYVKWRNGVKCSTKLSKDSF
jgi:hypothetical protein